MKKYYTLILILIVLDFTWMLVAIAVILRVSFTQMMTRSPMLDMSYAAWNEQWSCYKADLSRYLIIAHKLSLVAYGLTYN